VGKMRSDWNVALLQDVVAPSYVKLLHAVQADLEGRSEQYYQLWPQQRPAEPWGLLVDKLYASLLDQPVLWTDASGGRWVSPTEAVFAEPADEGDEAAAAIRASLVRSGMDLVVAPKPVLDLLQLAARSAGVMLTTANARTVRLWFQGDKDRQADLSVKEGTALLTHCLRDVGTGFVGGATAVDLIGLRLAPMASGTLGMIGTPKHADGPLLLCGAQEGGMLKERRPDLVLTADPAEPLGRALARVAASGQTNLKAFSAAVLSPLLPLLLPASWRGLEVASLDGEVEDLPSV
jgi:sacsin